MSRFDLRHKDTIQLFIREFFELFFPKIAPYINFESVQFLDKEFYALFENSEGDGDKDVQSRSDMLMMFEAKINGQKEIVLVHWEQQGEKEADFAKRMFGYFCGGYYKYKKIIFPIALFTDKFNWNARIDETFTLSFFSYLICKFRFRLIKLKDYTAEQFIQLAPGNPLVWAYLPLTRYHKRERPQIAHRAKGGVLETVKNDKKRATLFSLIEHSLDLTPEEEIEFKKICAKDPRFEEVGMLESFKDLYIEKGYDKGIAQGIDQGLKQGIEQGMTRGAEQKNLEIARLMKAEGEPAARIMKFTGLTAEEQDKL